MLVKSELSVAPNATHQDEMDAFAKREIVRMSEEPDVGEFSVSMGGELDFSVGDDDGVEDDTINSINAQTIPDADFNPPELSGLPYTATALQKMIFGTEEYDPGEFGNAQRFGVLYDGDYRYAADRKVWYAYNGKHWEKDYKDSVGHAMRYAILAMKEEIALATVRTTGTDDNSPQRAHLKGLRTHYRTSCAAAKIDAALRVAKTMPGIRISGQDFDSKDSAYLFNTPSGTIDLKTGALRPHKKDDFITLSATVDADRSAVPSLWLKTLDGIFCGDQALIDYVQKVFGSAMLGTRKASQEFYLLMGIKGSNGKSTLMNTVGRAFGGYAKHSAAQTWMKKFHEDSGTASPDLAELVNARLVLVAELPKGQEFNENRIKSFTGGDTMKARFLNENLLEFNPVGTLILSTNHRPRIDAGDSSMWRRSKAIPFLANFEKTAEGERLEEDLQKELPAILGWVLDGCLKYQSEGLRDIPEAVKDAIKEHKASLDTVQMFATECIDRVCSAEDANIKNGHYVKSAIVYDKFKEWSKENGYSFQMIRKNFLERMGQIGYAEEPTRFNNMRVIPGIRMRDFDF